MTNVNTNKSKKENIAIGAIVQHSYMNEDYCSHYYQVISIDDGLLRVRELSPNYSVVKVGNSFEAVANPVKGEFINDRIHTLAPQKNWATKVLN